MLGLGVDVQCGSASWAHKGRTELKLLRLCGRKPRLLRKFETSRVNARQVFSLQTWTSPNLESHSYVNVEKSWRGRQATVSPLLADGEVSDQTRQVADGDTDKQAEVWNWTCALELSALPPSAERRETEQPPITGPVLAKTAKQFSPRQNVALTCAVHCDASSPAVQQVIVDLRRSAAGAGIAFL